MRTKSPDPIAGRAARGPVPAPGDFADEADRLAAKALEYAGLDQVLKSAGGEWRLAGWSVIPRETSD